MLTEYTPPSGTPYTLQFQIKNIGHIPIIELEYSKDIKNHSNGGKLTTPLNMKLYKQLRVNQNFELSWGWKKNLVKVMTGYISHINLEKNSISLEFADKGSHLERTYKAQYKQWHRLKIIEDGINHSGLKPEMDYTHGTGDKIDYDCGVNDINGKTLENMINELMEKSTQDLALLIKENTCKIINLTHIPSTNTIPIYEGVNILKGSVNISEASSSLINHITLYYRNDTHKHHVTYSAKSSMDRFGVKHESIEETWIPTREHARDYVTKLLRKNIRENGLQINLTVIASPYYNLLTTCHVRLPKYGVDRSLRVSSLNFKASAGKTPTMDLCLHDYKPANIS